MAQWPLYLIILQILYLLLKLTHPGESPIFVHVANPGSLTVAISDMDEKVINFTIYFYNEIVKDDITVIKLYIFITLYFSK